MRYYLKKPKVCIKLPNFPRIGVKTLLFVGLPCFSIAALKSAAADDEAFAALEADAKSSFRENVAPFVTNYCLNCHGSKKTKGKLNLQPALKNPGDAAYSRAWAQVLANVKTHDMPPDDEDKQPTDGERQAFMAAVAKVKFFSPKDPGPFVIRRLTKFEYGNTLRDLLGVEPAIARELPDEVSGEGYLNTLSPLLMEQYLGIANEALNQALGPVNAPPTEMQRRLLGKSPTAPTDARVAAREFARSFARKAYRRPPSDGEVDVLMRVYDLAVQNNLPHPAALRILLKAILVSPQFLFITPVPSETSKSDIVSLDDYQLASRLSYLLWATMPDAELSKQAENGNLHEPAILKAQVQRLLKDSRSRALFDGFGAQWLGLGGLATKTFDTEKFPLMTAELRSVMYDEARLFFESIVRENRSVVNFVDGNYTFLNGALAKIYGLEKGVSGTEMRKVQLTNSNRGGILSMPGILAMTSFPNRTSAVKRGVWVLEQVLGEHVPPAPPNVPALDRQDKKTVANMTLRQRTELHRTNAVCANCHKVLDPIGFGLENFDAIGRWREQDDTGGAIDAAGELPGGKHFSSPKELKALIASRKSDLARNISEKLMAYALCRPLEGYDEIVVDRLMQAIQKDEYRMQTLIVEIVTSYPFTHCRIQSPSH